MQQITHQLVALPLVVIMRPVDLRQRVLQKDDLAERHVQRFHQPLLLQILQRRLNNPGLNQNIFLRRILLLRLKLLLQNQHQPQNVSQQSSLLVLNGKQQLSKRSQHLVENPFLLTTVKSQNLVCPLQTDFVHVLGQILHHVVHDRNLILQVGSLGSFNIANYLRHHPLVSQDRRIQHEVQSSLFSHFGEDVQEQAKQLGALDVDQRMSLSTNQGRKQHNNLSQILHVHNLLDVLFIVDQPANHLDLVNYVLPTVLLLPPL